VYRDSFIHIRELVDSENGVGKCTALLKEREREGKIKHFLGC